MHLWEYILLFGCVLIGGSIALYYKKYQQRYLNHMLTFSGAFIIGIAILHMIPVAFADGGKYTGMAMLAGFIVQLMLEQLSGGVEHGHIHAHAHGHNAYLFQVVIGLSLHAFFEGLPLGNHHAHSGSELLIGIILHKAPAAFALAALLLSSGFKTRTVVICLLLFASMSPLGAALAEYLGNTGLIDESVHKLIMAFVVGSFLHISTTILFETENSGGHHRLPMVKIFMISLGLGFAILTTLGHVH